MPNAAHLLAGLIESFAVGGKGQAVQNARVVDPSIAAPSRLEFWDRSLVAAGHLTEVVALIDALEVLGEPVDFYRAAIPAWAHAVFRPDIPWNAGSAAGVGIDARDLNMLRSLASNIDARGIAAIRDADLTAVIAALGEVEELTKDLDEKVRSRLLTLIRQARRFAEDVDLYGTDAALRIANEISGIMVAVITDESIDVATRSKTAEALKTLVAGIAVNFASAGLLALGDAGLKAITG